MVRGAAHRRTLASPASARAQGAKTSTAAGCPNQTAPFPHRLPLTYRPSAETTCSWLRTVVLEVRRSRWALTCRC